MNKTLSIGLAGYSFMIEEFAYTKLNNYLTALRNSLEDNEVDEVMLDIEIRIVEIFKESLGSREVIKEADVEKVIQQLGTPEAIEEQEEAYYSENVKKKRENPQRVESRKLFRDPEHTKIAGVCSGLAHYIGMDISLMRAIWLAMAFIGIFTAGISTLWIILSYIILWAVLPVATTASDFLKMKGKPIDFNNIKEESVRFASESSNKISDFYKKNGSTIWNIFRKILAFIMMIIAFKVLVAIVLASLGMAGIIYMEGFNEIEFYLGDFSYLVMIIVTLVGGIITLIFLALSIKLFSPKTKIRYWGILILLLFLGLLGLGTYFGLEVSKDISKYSGYNDNQENIVVNAPNGEITLDIKKVNIPSQFKAFGNEIFSNKNRVFEKDRPDVYLIRKDNVQPHLIVKKTAKGYNVPIKMNIPLEVRNGEILLPNYFEYSYTDRFRDYDVKYELVVPQNISVFSKNHWIDLEEENYIQSNPSHRENGTNIHHQQHKSSVNINENRIDYNSDEPDIIRINGKSYSPYKAKKIAEDSLKLDIEDLLNIDIEVENGRERVIVR